MISALSAIGLRADQIGRVRKFKASLFKGGKMCIWLNKLKHGFKNSAYLFLAIIFAFAGAGCASTHKTTTTETTVTTSPSADQEIEVRNNEGYIIRHQDAAVVEKSETTTSTTVSNSGHPGIISSTVHAIGWVIALPFRLLGGLIGWIF